MADLPNSATDLWLSDSDVTAGHWRPSLVAPQSPHCPDPPHTPCLTIIATDNWPDQTYQRINKLKNCIDR